ncbi:hypothetical protein ACJX0J_015968, partial [Zea mays]
MRLLKGNLQAVVAERDESRRQVAEASLCIDSLSKHLEETVSLRHRYSRDSAIIPNRDVP